MPAQLAATPTSSIGSDSAQFQTVACEERQATLSGICSLSVQCLVLDAHLRMNDAPSARPAAGGPAQSAVPLFVDLDHTLVAVDTFVESIRKFVVARPWDTFRLVYWLVQNRPLAKQRLAEQGFAPDPATLPYRQDLLDFLVAEKTAGRPLILATATDQQIAHRVADHLGIFDKVLASDGTLNLKSRRKLAAIRDLCADCSWSSFAYLGDSNADLTVWHEAAEIYVADPKPGVMRKLSKAGRSPTRLFLARPRSGALLTTAPDPWWTAAGSENVLIVGATSGVGRALCHRLAQRNCRLALAARNATALQELADELRDKYRVQPIIETFDALDFSQHEALLERCRVKFGDEIDGIVVLHGILPAAESAATEFSVARETIDINFTSVVSLLTPLAAKMQAAGSGWIAVVSSVAGDRGRQSNYIYGSSKAGLTAYLQGLRNRLYSRDVHVLTIKPGFIDTPMTAGRIDANSPLVARADRVAADIDRAIRRRRDVLYTPWFWVPIMAVVRWMPEWVFKRLKL